MAHRQASPISGLHKDRLPRLSGLQKCQPWGFSPCTHHRPPGKESFNVGLSDLVFKDLSLTSFQRSRSPESLAGREYLILLRRVCKP